MTSSRENSAILAARGDTAEQNGGGKHDQLPPPAFVSVLRVGPLAVNASPAAAWRRLRRKARAAAPQSAVKACMTKLLD